MTTEFRSRIIARATVGFAVATLLGWALTPTAPQDPGALLETLSRQPTLCTIVYVMRMLSAILVTPALLGALHLLANRGTSIGYVAAALLVVGHVADAGVSTLMAAVFSVLAPATDRRVAVTTTELILSSELWIVLGVFSLAGIVVGFASIGIALWRAGAVPRWAATCLSPGPIVHISAGDWPWTKVGGSVMVAGGITTIALHILRESTLPAPARAGRRTTADPAQFMVSTDDA
jgi:hypothetical protein